MKIYKKRNRLLRIFFRLIVFTFVPIGSPGQQSPNIGNLQVFPINNPWNWDISNYQIHPNSANYIASIGENTSIHPDFGTVYGIPYIVVNNSQVKYPINYTLYAEESDPGPFPIPLNAPLRLYAVQPLNKSPNLPRCQYLKDINIIPHFSIEIAEHYQADSKCQGQSEVPTSK